MSKKIRILIIAASLAAVLALGIGGAAMASSTKAKQANTAALSTGDDYGPGIGLGGSAICTDNVTQLLGLTQDEIQTMRQQGMSLLQIAESQNVTQEQLVTTITAARQAWIDESVANGTLTQEQATIMEQNMESNVIRMINHTTGKPDRAGQGANGKGNGNAYGRQGRGNGYGMMGSYGDPGDCAGPGNANQHGRNAR